MKLKNKITDHDHDKYITTKFGILNGAKYSSLQIFQNQYLYQLKNTLNILLALLGLNHENLTRFQKKVLQM